MSEPQLPDERIELETVVNWRMIAAGAGLGAAVLVAAVAFLLLAGARKQPGTELALAPRPAEPTKARANIFLPRKETPPAAQRSEPAVPSQPAALAELLPPPAVENPPPAREPVRVVAAAPPPAPREKTQEAKAVPAEPPAFKRISPYSETQLLSQLDAQAKEIDLDATEGTAARLLADAPKATSAEAARNDKDAPYPLPAAQPVLDLLAERADLKGLPVRKGKECQSDAKATAVLGRISRELRTETARRTRRPAPGVSQSEVIERDLALVSYLASQKGWCDESAVPALVQMLQGESAPVRLQLVTMLTAVKGEKASQALAQRSVFDLSPEVREAAVKALKDRPRAEGRQPLLDGLRYPWAPAARHAAEALVELRDRAAVPALAALLNEPDPEAPARDKDDRWTVTELVRVNHLRNCLMCHAPSVSDREPVRGLVPEKGKELPVVYYERGRGPFVRADVVYLKQDFSVLQPVPNAAPWPTVQRFDYLIRRRELTKEEVKKLPPAKAEKGPPAFAQRQAVLWALRQLTGAGAVDCSEDLYRVRSGWSVGRAL
jgi:hypothetical protein